MEDLPEYVLERLFDAPVALVWRAWSEAELLGRWYGPGVETIIHRLDVRVGGLWLNEMKMGGNSYYQRVEYTEVVDNERLVWLHSNADANWNITASPMMADWPMVLLTVVTFKPVGDKTELRLTWQPHEAGEAEIAAFSAAVGGMGRGWNAGMNILDDILAELQGQATAGSAINNAGN